MGMAASNSTFFQQRPNSRILPCPICSMLSTAFTHTPYTGTGIRCLRRMVLLLLLPGTLRILILPRTARPLTVITRSIWSFFDLLSKRYTDCKSSQSGRRMNSRHYDRKKPVPGTIPIFIADQEVHSLNVFAHAIKQYSYFLIRATNMQFALSSFALDLCIAKTQTFWYNIMEHYFGV